jgi:hypothetical protein
MPLTLYAVLEYADDLDPPRFLGAFLEAPLAHQARTTLQSAWRRATNDRDTKFEVQEIVAYDDVAALLAVHPPEPAPDLSEDPTLTPAMFRVAVLAAGCCHKCGLRGVADHMISEQTTAIEWDCIECGERNDTDDNHRRKHGQATPAAATEVDPV